MHVNSILVDRGQDSCFTSRNKKRKAVMGWRKEERNFALRQIE